MATRSRMKIGKALIFVEMYALLLFVPQNKAARFIYKE